VICKYNEIYFTFIGQKDKLKTSSFAFDNKMQEETIAKIEVE
jgi:hypothetical protein